MEILYFGFMSDSIIFKRNEKKKSILYCTIYV